MLDMANHLSGGFDSPVPGGVRLIRVSGGYTGPGGLWEESEAEPVTLGRVNVQPVNMKEAQFIIDNGGATRPEDIRLIHINDGTMLRVKDDDGSFDLLEFSDGVSTRQWLVYATDNRPWRTFCRAHVVRYRGAN